MEMRCYAPGARTQPATAIIACAVLENAYFTPGARTKPATAIMACAVLENVVWCLLRDLSARNCE